jgi:hypothetical protein
MHVVISNGDVQIADRAHGWRRIEWIATLDSAILLATPAPMQIARAISMTDWK